MKTGVALLLFCTALSLPAMGAKDSCAVGTGRLIGPPREASPPWPEGVGEGMSRLGPPVHARMVSLFREVGHRPFGIALCADFLELSRGRASSDIKMAFLAGGLKRGREPHTYEFRKGRAPGGWQSFYEYGDFEGASILARAYGLFGEETFPLGEFAERFGASGRNVRNLLRDAVLSGILVRGKKRGTYAFVASPLDVGDLLKRASFLEGIGLPLEVWHRAHLLDGAVFDHMRHSFGLIAPGRIFGESDYREIVADSEVAKFTNDMARVEIRAGVLVGIIRVVEDAGGRRAFAFATEPGPAGLEAFFEYGPEAYGVVQGLNESFGRFGRRPFSRGELMEGVDGDARVDYEAMLREGPLAGVLIKGEDGTFSFADSFEPRAVPRDSIRGVPRRAYALLRRAGIPFGVWKRAHLLGPVQIGHLVDALEEFGDRPFGLEECARHLGIDMGTARRGLLRWARLVGLVERRENLYAFRKNAAPGGWVMFYEPGNTTLKNASKTLPNLERIFGRFGRVPFTLGQSLEALDDLSVDGAKGILWEGILADVLRREGSSYVFTADPPTQREKEVLRAKFSRTVMSNFITPVAREVPPDIYALLDRLGIPRAVWGRAHLLREAVLAHVGRALGKYGLDPFDVVGYCDLAGLHPKVGIREIKFAILAGVIERGPERGTYVFRREADAGGWAAFAGYGSGAGRSERYLRLALGLFGDAPFTAEKFIGEAGIDNALRDTLQRVLLEGFVAGLLHRTERRGEFVSAVPVPPRRLASRGGLLATQIADVPREAYLLLDELGVPWEVWERGHLLGGVVLSRLVLALRGFGTDPFTPKEYAALVGIDSDSLASRDLRDGFLAGLVRREEGGGRYAFRTTKAPGGWDVLLLYGSNAGEVVRLLTEALGVFGENPFGIRSLAGRLAIGLPQAKRILADGKLTGLLLIEKMGEYRFAPKFVDGSRGAAADVAPVAPAAPAQGVVRRDLTDGGEHELTGVPGMRTIQDIWGRNVERLHLRSQVLGSSMDVWNRAHLLKAPTLGALVSLFEKFGLGPFGVGDYRGLTGVSERVAVRELRSAVLAGVIERVRGTDGFAVRKTPGPSGWEALEEWDEGGLLYCLEEAFEEFGDGVFSAEDFRAFKGTLSRELFDGSSLDGLEEGLVSGVLERRPGGYGFAASPP